jgi:hypothetical protein
VRRSQLAGEAKSSTFASKLAPTEDFKSNFNSLLGSVLAGRHCLLPGNSISNCEDGAAKPMAAI